MLLFTPLLGSNNKLKGINKQFFFWISAFSLYALVTDLSTHFFSRPRDAIFSNLEMVIGPLSFLPFYILALRNFNRILNIILKAGLVYYSLFLSDLTLGTNFHLLSESERSINLNNQTRLLGVDVRQTFSLCLFILPLILEKYKLPLSHRGVVIFSSTIFMVTQLIGNLRMSLFYHTAALVHIYIFHVKRKIRFIPIFVGLILIFVSFFDLKTFQGLNVFNYLNTYSTDDSFEIRFSLEAPFLLDIISKYPILGIGPLNYSDRQINTGFFAWQDVPILGSAAVFGFLGLILYFVRYLFIYKVYKKVTVLGLKNSFELSIFKALNAYFVTMVLYRLFYITWELSFPYQLIEFGFISGLYFALASRLLNEPSTLPRFRTDL
jgi:hypothetical protein